MQKSFEHRNQDQRKSIGEQLMEQLRHEEEADFSFMFQPPHRVPETD